MEKKARTPMNKQMKSLLYKATSLVLLGIFMCTAVFGYLSRSFGWFSDNTEVSASGMSVQSSDGLDVEVNFSNSVAGDADTVLPNISGNMIGFEDLVPNTRMLIGIELINHESKAVTVTLSLAAPTDENEKPVITDGQYTYFGAHLRINSFTIPSSGGSATDVMADTLSGTQQYLLTLEDSEYTTFKGVSVPNTFTEEYSFSNAAVKTLTDPISIPAGESIIVTMELEFVDNNDIQNPLINFAKPGGTGVCSRKIICTTTEN